MRGRNINLAFTLNYLQSGEKRKCSSSVGYDSPALRFSPHPGEEPGFRAAASIRFILLKVLLLFILTQTAFEALSAFKP